MASIGKYCKAYNLSELKKYKKWDEHVLDDPKSEPEKLNLEDAGIDDIVFLHHDFTVTRNIYSGEHVLYNTVTEDWKEFCEKTLDFKVPNYVS